MPTHEEIRAVFERLTANDPIAEAASAFARSIADIDAAETRASESEEGLLAFGVQVWRLALWGSAPSTHGKKLSPALLDEPLAPWLAALGVCTASTSSFYVRTWLKEVVQAWGIQRMAPPLFAVLDAAPKQPYRAVVIESLTGEWPAELLTPRAVRILARGVSDGAQMRAACLPRLKANAAAAVPLLEQALLKADKASKRFIEAALDELRPKVDIAAAEPPGIAGSSLAPDDNTPGLAGALQAVECGDYVTALTRLLDEWVVTRDAATADLIDAVAAKLPKASLSARSKVEEQRLFLDIVARDRPEDLSPLLAMPWPAAQWRLGRERVLALAKRSPDPRTAAALMKLTSPKLYDSWNSYPFWTALFTTVLDLGDRRRTTELETVADEAHKSVYYVEKTVGKALVELLKHRSVADALAHHPVREPPDPGSLAAWRALLATSSMEANGEDLLAEVYRKPDDDDARRVYADWLVTRGDPRGELIQLQCERARGSGTEAMAKKEQRLLSKSQKHWLDGLAPLARDEHIEFERGFVASVSLDAEAELLTRLVGLPIWSLIREIVFSHARKLDAESLVAFVTKARLVSLRSLHGMSLAALAKMAAESAIPPLEEVGVRKHDNHKDDSPTWTGIDGNLACVRALAVTSTRDLTEPQLQWLPESPLWQQLESVALGLPEDQPLRAAMEWFERHASKNLAEARVFGPYTVWTGKPTGWDLRLTRDEHARFSVLRARWHADVLGNGLNDLVQKLETIEPGTLNEITIEQGVALEVDAYYKEAIQDSLTRIGVAKADFYWSA